jgi:hypothetical protein
MKQNSPEKKRRGWNTGGQLTESKRETNSMKIVQSARREREKRPAIKETIYTGTK